MCDLSEFLKETAARELGENEFRKKQSLELMRSWLKNHEFITDTRIDETYLIIFLRAKKYRMDDAFKSFENTLIFFYNNPEYNALSETDVVQFLSICKKIFKLSKFRDEGGIKSVLTTLSQMEALRLTALQIVKMAILFATGCLSEEEIQICGINLIIDCRGLSFSYIQSISIRDMVELVLKVNSFPVRLKRILVVGMPSYATVAYNLLRGVLPEKLKSRLVLCDSLDQIQDVRSFKSDLNEFKEDDFMCIDRNLVKIFQKFEEMTVDFNKIRKFEAVGSFRKLEID